MSHRHGTILIVTIWVTLVLAGLVLMFGRSMRISAYVAANAMARQQADTILDGGVQYALARLEDEDFDAADDDETPYKAKAVGNGYLWLLKSSPDDDGSVEYGLNDESAKINLNSASLEMLQKLPGMTSELAASIIDWRDEDGDLTEGGAEDEYYLMLSSPYSCKNADLESVEEILLIQGGSEEILFGEDTNCNSMLDDNEDNGDESEPEDDRDGILDSGLYDYVTVYSQEENVDADGNKRINITDTDARSDLQTLLEGTFEEDRALEILAMIPSTNVSYDNILDFYYESGMELKEFEQIADKLTTDSNETLVGLVNVNTASQAVLECLPELEASDAEALIQKREASNTNLDSIAWVIEALGDDGQDKAIAIGSYITVRSSQYTADVVSASGNGRAFRRARVVLDSTDSLQPIRSWKSLTHLGWPLERETLTTLQEGRSLR